jgi:hypothetical protein
MGHGNVYLSLALAKEQLAAVGITRPTPQQLEASLMGGNVTTSEGKTTLQGVLEMRSQNMGWGQIAHELGFKLGPVVSGMKSANARLSAPATSASTTTGPPSSAAAAEGTTRTAGEGVVTGAGATSGVRSNKSGHAIVTGAGSAAGSGQGHAYGRGMTTAAGGAAAAYGAKSGSNGKALGKIQ